MIDKNQLAEKTRILVVDDENLMRRSITRLLVHNSYCTESVAGGEEALLMLHDQPFDIVLSDVMMPKMNGIQLLEKIRVDHPDVDVVMITGYGTIKMAVEALKIGAYDFLQKPYDNEKLLTVIKRAQEKRKLANELKLVHEQLLGSLQEKELLLQELHCRMRETEIQNKNFHYILNNDSTGIIVTSQTGIVVFANPAAKKLFHRSESELIGNEFGIPITVSDTEIEVDIICESGEIGVGELQSMETEWEGNKAFLVLIRDETENFRLRDELRELAYQDELTGLDNRRAFFLLSNQQLRLAGRAVNSHQQSAIGLFFIDLDRMKTINDTLGHKEGDRALIATAGVLWKTFRKTDIIARLGGNEFAVLAIDPNEEEDLLLERLQKNVDDFNDKKTASFILSLSVGAAWYDAATPCTIEELVKKADGNMYEEKQRKCVRQGCLSDPARTSGGL